MRKSMSKEGIVMRVMSQPWLNIVQTSLPPGRMTERGVLKKLGSHHLRPSDHIQVPCHTLLPSVCLEASSMWCCPAWGCFPGLLLVCDLCLCSLSPPLITIMDAPLPSTQPQTSLHISSCKPVPATVLSEGDA